MSVQKLSDESKFIKEKVPFAQICTNVINNIKNGDAFLVWAYLQAKTKNWKVIKQDIKKRYGFGNTKLKRIFSYLNRSNLIKYVQRIGSNGQFELMDIMVLNGSKFDKNQQFTCKERLIEPVGQETVPSVNRSVGSGPLLNKDITKQRKKNDTNITCSSNDELSSFEQFWLLYPRKQKKHDSKKAWIKHRLYEQVDEIQSHLMKRVETEWKGKDKKWLPLPTSFLNGKMWNDEIIIEDTKTITKAPNGRDVSYNYLKNEGIL